MKTQITTSERMQLIGLVTVAKHHNAALETLKNAAMELLDIDGSLFGTNDPADHVSDLIYGSREPDDMLRIIGVSVQKDKKKIKAKP